MTNIAKVFIVINFVLSILYLGFAATLLAHKWDYRQMYLDMAYRHEQESREFQNKMNDADKRAENFEKYLSEAKELANKYKKDLQTLQKTHEELKRKSDSDSATLANISAEIKDINGKIAKKDDRIKELEDEKERLKGVVEEARKAKEEALNEQQRIEFELSNQQGALAEKEKLLQKAEKELWESKQIIRVVRDAGVNIPNLFKPAKALDGQIVSVSNDVPLVMISLGTDDGVQKGYQFTVYRQNNYVGRVTVEEVYKDMCAARIIKDMTVKSIKQGDSVTTRLGSSGGSF